MALVKQTTDAITDFQEAASKIPDFLRTRRLREMTQLREKLYAFKPIM